MKFGLHFLLSCAEHQTPQQLYREAIDQCVDGEALGFESAWPVEHHFNLKVSSLSCPSLLLAAIAERTQRMRLGTAIVQLPLAHPLRVAEELATLDVLSDGRVEVGIGRGANPAHFGGFNVSPAESRDRLAEGLQLLRTAFTEERFSFEGKFWQARGASLVPRPIQPRPRIHVAANSPETAAFAGQTGCAALFAAHVNPFPKLKELLAIYRNARREAGHGEAPPEDVTLLMPTYIASSLQQVRDELEPSVLHSAQLTASLLEIVMQKVPSEAERNKLLPLLEHLRSIDFQKVRTTMGVAGTPSDVRERFVEIEREFNPGRVIAWFNYGGLVPHAHVRRSMALFAKTMW
jgi:alkanesulfonate monooxygenase SsuD/methylene tetrahydromethanopterin reductase-like flavin-dependent oxidoreductase (luciferase family)